MNLLSSFENDPFFAGVKIERGLEFDNRRRENDDHRQLFRRRCEKTNENSKLATNQFSFMDNMMNNMEKIFTGIEKGIANGNSVSFCSSSVMTVDNRNGGIPRIFQAASEKLRGPDGFERTRRAMRDSEQNLEKMEIAHRIGDRARTITKERDQSTGEILENREFRFIDDENQFEQEWFSRAEQLGLKNINRTRFTSKANDIFIKPSLSTRRRTHSLGPRSLAIESRYSANSNSRSRI